MSVLIVGVLAGVALVYLAYHAVEPSQRGLRALLACWTSIPYVLAGAIAWRRRPDSRMGPLMVAAGLVTFLSFLNWAESDLLFTLATALQFAPPVMFLWVYLAYPSGRVRATVDRVVLSVAAVAASLTLVYMAFGYEGERNLLMVTDEPDLAGLLHDQQLLWMSVALVAGAVILIQRRVVAGKSLRPWLNFLIDSFVLVLLMLAFLYLVHLTEWTIGTEAVRLTTFGLLGVAPIVFLYGLLQTRLGTASVATLMVELGVNPGPVDLEEAVSRALRDPSARLVYWVPEFEAYADSEGRQASTEPGPGTSVLPIIRDGHPVALLVHDSGLNDEPELLSSVATATGMAIENARLQVELRARLEELRGSRMRILDAEEQERRRLERDLHDGAQQRLIALSMALGELGERVAGDPELEEKVAEAKGEVSASLTELRDLAHGIHPAAIIDHGLGVAIESLATRTPLPVQIEGEVPDGLPEHVAVTAYYLVSESLTNAVKHGRADSVVIRLTMRSDAITVEVEDDGVGGADTEGGTGLRGLADRVEAIGGRLRVWSPPGGGTRVRADIPCGP